MKCWIVPALLLTASPAEADDFSGAGRGIDGDSLFVDGREVRLFGIDAPEFRQNCRMGFGNWSCGSDSAAELRRLIASHPLTCASVDRDVYGRTVARCQADGVDLGAAMLEKGMAVTLDNAPPAYAAIAGRSKTLKVGIWASEFAMPATYRAANPRTSRSAVAAFTPLPRTVAAVRVPVEAYRNCAEARAAGAAPLRRGTPGYGAHLDGDGDGVACEPYRRR